MMVTQTAEQNMGTNIGGVSGVAVVATPTTTGAAPTATTGY